MALMAVQLLAPAASAASVSQKRAEAARLTSELEAASNRVEIAAEKVDQARIKVDTLRRGVADAEAKMREADQHAAEVKSALRTQAVNTYMRGGQAPTVNAGSDPARAGAYVRVISGEATDAIDQMRGVRINMAQRRDELNRARASADAALAAVNAQQR